MSFDVHLKKAEANETSHILGVGIRSFNVSTLDISDGLLVKGSYRIPVEHILFIKEV